MQERNQRPAMQLHLAARRSDQRNMHLSQRGEAARMQAEPSAGRRLVRRAAPETVERGGITRLVISVNRWAAVAGACTASSR
jgi:hypothetical protein